MDGKTKKERRGHSIRRKQIDANERRVGEEEVYFFHVTYSYIIKKKQFFMY